MRENLFKLCKITQHICNPELIVLSDTKSLVLYFLVFSTTFIFCLSLVVLSPDLAVYYNVLQRAGFTGLKVHYTKDPNSKHLIFTVPIILTQTTILPETNPEPDSKTISEFSYIQTL